MDRSSLLLKLGVFVLLQSAFAQSVTLTITRQHTGARCTSGQLALNGRVLGYTLERPWEGNIPIISSIPPGRYKAFVRTTSKDRWRIELSDVPRRENVQIHIGNYVPDGVGCILIGRTVNKDLCSLEDSKFAFDNFKVEFEKAAGGAKDKDVQVSVVILDATK
jgi:hypothetical protein